MDRWGYRTASVPGRTMAVTEKLKSGYSQTTVTINEFGLEQLTRTSPTGKTKSRMTVTIKAVPFTIVTDPRELGRPVAMAIETVLREKMRNIMAVAAPSTIDRRKRSAVALTDGERWATKRYAGGRMGEMAPTGSVRLFNDSGRFAESLKANIGKQGEWKINVAVNRLDPSTFRSGVAGVDAMYRRLVSLVPEFAQPAELLKDPRVIKAREQAIDFMLSRNAALKDRLARARASVLSSVASTILNGLR